MNPFNFILFKFLFHHHSVFGGIFQNTVYGMAAKLPPKYTGAVVLGSNISGTFATIISILSGSIWSSVRKAAIYYFITAMFVILLCFDTYFAMPLNKFYRYHEMQSEKEQEKRPGQIVANARPPYWTIFKRSFPQLFNVFFIFFVTLSIFPTVYSDIKSVNEGEDFLGIVPPKMFVQITCFLTFNVFAMLGSLTTSWIQWVSFAVTALKLSYSCFPTTHGRRIILFLLL
jgi:equilibrative nucleoside transporter 1/2/3